MLLSSSAKDTAYCLIGDMVIFRYFSKSFALVNTMKYTRPLSNGNFPMEVYTSWALFIQGIIGRVAVDKNIVSAWEQLVKRDK